MKSAIAACLSVTAASASPAGYFELAQGAVFETGDTVVSEGRRIRLYGLQSCLRGTPYTDRSGTRRDCGEASIAVLAAFIKDTKPVCAPVAEQSDLIFVVCYAQVGNQQLDLAMMMITEGYGFASLKPDGLPVHPPYAVAEQEARERRRGLWRFKDVQHPAILLSHAARNLRSAP
ncbi:thermonuclease family protein (plasmid) [Rhizobium sp. RCAM05350]|uniref:thermonuclease family protein n=1 Tax=Rhizobium sp. RCAM05350 TaxID=2895568 RepID=UPI002076704E|nr:thermonuclease family protein [Rhizobium sp. RCAM05350]URK89567.1 thermonuclease family protein [Rhizobium sp. RCAM05350]